MNIIVLFISILLDGIVSMLFKSDSYFIGLFTVTYLFYIYPKYNKKNNKYNHLLIISGFIYDLFYTGNYFFHSILFFILGFIIKYIYKNFDKRKGKYYFYLILLIFIYNILLGSILFIFRIVPINYRKVMYLFSHSIIINLFYYFILKKYVYRESK